MSRPIPTGLQRRQMSGEVILRDAAGTERRAIVASTNTPDRYEDIVDQATWNLAPYRANPVMPCDHEYEVEKLVCNGDVAVVDGRLVVEPINWSDDPFSAMVKAKYDAKILRAVSVGFIPGRSVARNALEPNHPYYKKDGWGFVFYDCELLEISFVVVPANPEALATDSVSRAAPVVDIDALVSEVARRLSGDPTFAARVLAAPAVEPEPTNAPSAGLDYLWRIS